MMDTDLLQPQCIHDGDPTLPGKAEHIQYCLVAPNLVFQEIQQVLLVVGGASIPILPITLCHYVKMFMPEDISPVMDQCHNGKAL